ncbi:SWIM zinc finger family protein [Actinomadura barringtoniae]|uniref:SWIM zinc finger family protein n=1 Tax=Actinomadura barringtoniae TaxID=1427535 RepID=A0A939T692_9ACTN|nr:SWIM zinc finger family protein [Actinomadura barringtoniae]MBO2450549.1 SWIM zinc finger family protein [Actinomadura barringtoniae]
MADFSEYGPPRPVEDGLKAMSRRGSIGAEWWSRRFIDLVESFADTGRLQRGRAYARKGQVINLRVHPYEVTARVQGSREEPYEVALGIDAIEERDWRDIEAALASRAVFRARLLAGEMPPEIEEVFAEFGLSLFPEAAADLHLMCSCPDWGDPCKHSAAVLYLLAEQFDRDPFLIMEWNGRTKEQLLTALRRRPAGEPDPFEMDEAPLTAEGFWTPPSGLARLRERPPAPPVPPGFILQVATPPPIRIRRRDLTDVLAPAYEALAPEE